MKTKTAIILAPILSVACLAICLASCYVAYTYGAPIDDIRHWYNVPASLIGAMTAVVSGVGFFVSWVMIPISTIK